MTFTHYISDETGRMLNVYPTQEEAEKALEKAKDKGIFVYMDGWDGIGPIYNWASPEKLSVRDLKERWEKGGRDEDQE